MSKSFDLIASILLDMQHRGIMMRFFFIIWSVSILAGCKDLNEPLNKSTFSSHSVNALALEAKLPINDDNILGSYYINAATKPKPPFKLPPIYLLMVDEGHAGFIRYPVQALPSACNSSWSLEGPIFTSTFDCSTPTPGMPLMSLKIDLSDIDENMLYQGFEADAEFTNFEQVGTLKGRVLITKVKENTDLMKLTIRSGEHSGLKQGDKDYDDILAGGQRCQSHPCFTLLYFDGKIGVRLNFDTEIKNLTSAALFQQHLREASLRIYSQFNTKVIEVADLSVTKSITFSSFDQERLQFRLAGIIEELESLTLQHRADGGPAHETFNVSMPYDISFDLKVIKDIRN